MEESRTKLISPSSLEWILEHDSSFFANKTAKSVNRRYSDLQVVPNDDVFDPLWMKNDEDVAATRTFHDLGLSDRIVHTRTNPVDVQINKLNQSTRKDSADSLDVYLKPCVITPTKVEDLYSTLDDNIDDNVFLFPPNEPEATSLTRITNFEQLIGDNNSRDQYVSYHDNIQPNQESTNDSPATFGAMNCGNYQVNALQGMHHSGLFFPPFLKYIPQESCITTKTEPSCPSLISEQSNSKSTFINHDSDGQNLSNPCEIEDSHERHNTTFFESAAKDSFQYSLEVQQSIYINRHEGKGTESRHLKAFHNDTEKQRRDQMKNRFESLRKMIPKVEKLQKAPKILILRKAWEYIVHLQKEDDKLHSIKESLKLSNKQLLDKLQIILK